MFIPLPTVNCAIFAIPSIRLLSSIGLDGARAVALVATVSAYFTDSLVLPRFSWPSSLRFSSNCAPRAAFPMTLQNVLIISLFSPSVSKVKEKFTSPKADWRVTTWYLPFFDDTTGTEPASLMAYRGTKEVSVMYTRQEVPFARMKRRGDPYSLTSGSVKKEKIPPPPPPRPAITPPNASKSAPVVPRISSTDFPGGPLFEVLPNIFFILSLIPELRLLTEGRVVSMKDVRLGASSLGDAWSGGVLIVCLDVYVKQMVSST